jgi:long-chain acyl-CoA synthetase
VIASDPPDPRLGRVADELGVGVATDLDPFGLPASTFEPFAGRSSDDLAAIHFTSGTTGTPRGVAHRIRDFVGNAQRFAAATGLDASHRLHATLPMTYMAGYYNLLLLPWTIGASVVIDRAFDAASLLRFWDAPRAHGVDTLWLVPTIMAMLLELDRGEEGPQFVRDRVEFVACGTAPLDPAVREQLEQFVTRRRAELGD